MSCGLRCGQKRDPSVFERGDAAPESEVYLFFVLADCCPNFGHVLTVYVVARGLCAVFSEFLFSVTFFIRRERSRAEAATPNDDRGMDPRDERAPATALDRTPRYPGYVSRSRTGL